MNPHSSLPSRQLMKLFVCSDCEACSQATAFLQGWMDNRSDIDLQVISIMDQPEEIVRLGITHTPALVLDDTLLGENISVITLGELLRSHLNGPEAASQLPS